MSVRKSNMDCFFCVVFDAFFWIMIKQCKYAEMMPRDVLSNNILSFGRRGIAMLCPYLLD
jgi:hypothetical protein